jgi:hypothetical protein
LPITCLHFFTQLGDFGVEILPLDPRRAAGQAERQAQRTERGHGLPAAMPSEHGDPLAPGWRTASKLVARVTPGP